MTIGNPLKLILLFSLPVLFGNLFQQFYNMVDTIIVGQFLGEDALAAVGATSFHPDLLRDSVLWYHRLSVQRMKAV